MTTLTLKGCSPVPLAHYLKALGILRIVAEQLDSSAKACWINDRLLLESAADEGALLEFFARQYRPTPVLAPWNGGSGFFPKDNGEPLLAIENGLAGRFEAFREGIKAARLVLNQLAMQEKPEDRNAKTSLLQICRNVFSDHALGWLDAVFVLGQEGVQFPPLLGTGGNDGRLEFTNNFMQRLAEVINPNTGEPTAESLLWLRAAMLESAAPGLTTRAPVGQFFPGAAGGANATSGFDAPSAVNPWDFILMIEGALLFAAATVKRLESLEGGALIYPFCVRQTGVGYASAAGADELEARCEMWMPIWNEPTTYAELSSIFREGRAQVRGRNARSGVDFAQAAVTMGVDRGITAFQRYGFQVRNGLAYFATPLERVATRRNARADLLADIEEWYDRLRQKAGPRANPAPPASVARGLNLLDRSIIEFCRDGSPDNLQTLIAALGNMERALAQSFKWTSSAFLTPLMNLRKSWLDCVDENSNQYREFRLARSLAGMRAPLGDEIFWFRQHLEPISIGFSKSGSWCKWNELGANDVAWQEGNIITTLNKIMLRRLMRIEKAGVSGWPDWAPFNARLDDISALIEGALNYNLLADLIWGLSLINWGSASNDWQKEADEANRWRQWQPLEQDDAHKVIPSAFYALIRLCFRRAERSQKPIPVVPAIIQRAISGQGQTASIIAARRLASSGMPSLVPDLPIKEILAHRTAAALLFPIHQKDFRLLEIMILPQPN